VFIRKTRRFIWVSFEMENSRVKGLFFMMTSLFIRETFSKENIKDRGIIIKIMFLYIKEDLKMVRKMVRVFILLIASLIMMEISKRINLMVRAKWSPRLLFMKAIGKTIKSMVKDFMTILMELHISASTRIIKDMVMAS
jgi:hypothetical protein